MFTLIKNGVVYAPEFVGPKDILISQGKILMLQEQIALPAGFSEHQILDAGDSLILPGFVDQHVHIAGAGGEGGPRTRTPEINLTELSQSGITTVVGLLGFDGFTRSMPDLLAKARALESEGITSYVYTGAYELPTTTVTGSVKSDLILIDKVIGVGEIAVSDHRSSQPTLDMLIKIASETRIGGLLGNKAGIVHVHVGEGKQGLSLLFEAAKNSDIPLSQFVPTHVNRLAGLFEEAIEFIKLGGTIDLTAGFGPGKDSPNSLNVSSALEKLIIKGVDLSKVTLSSDANGSMPVFDPAGKLIKLERGSPMLLWNDLRQAILDKAVSLPQAVSLITRNPARLLNLYPDKGVLKPGSDADLVIIDRNSLRIKTVMAKGNLMVNNETPVVKGTFE